MAAPAPVSVLMIGTGEYTTGYGANSAQTDKGGENASKLSSESVLTLPYSRRPQPALLDSQCLTCANGDLWAS